MLVSERSYQDELRQIYLIVFLYLVLNPQDVHYGVMPNSEVLYDYVPNM